MKTPQKQFGLIIIGDEILSGKREDKHFSKVRELLAARGLQLAWVKYLGDDRSRCEAALRESLAGSDVVFSCGGIGATPDDHTRQSAAAALGVPLVLHPEARELITRRCIEMAAKGQGSADMSTPENLQRLKMGEFPQGARIIANPYNQIPGFNVQDHWFVPGFPVMAWPMIEAALDTHYAAEFNREVRGEKSFLVYEMPESRVTPLMEEIEARFSGVKVFSLPSVGDDKRARHIELGVKGPQDLLDAAYRQLLDGTLALQGRVEEGAA
jgi:molybdopterin-biosynthesis enzyme MoeA-like protein